MEVFFNLQFVLIEFVTPNLSQIYFCLSEIFKTTVQNRGLSTKSSFEFVFSCWEFTMVILIGVELNPFFLKCHKSFCIHKLFFSSYIFTSFIKFITFEVIIGEIPSPGDHEYNVKNWVQSRGTLLPLEPVIL